MDLRLTPAARLALAQVRRLGDMTRGEALAGLAEADTRHLLNTLQMLRPIWRTHARRRSSLKREQAMANPRDNESLIGDDKMRWLNRRVETANAPGAQRQELKAPGENRTPPPESDEGPKSPRKSLKRPLMFALLPVALVVPPTFMSPAVP